MEYPEVKSAHIVPRMYLRAWANDDERVAVNVIGKPGTFVTHVDNAGTRRRYYQRERPDGTKIDDIEWSLSQAEATAAPLLAALPAEWPPSTEDEATLGALFGLQYIRGPRWKAWREQRLREWVAGKRVQVPPERRPTGEPLTEADWDKVEEAITGSTGTFRHMLEVSSKMATVFGSMHWTLVDFATPVLATSDQPVALWPLGERGRVPAPAPPSIGMVETLEIRVPVSPMHLLLLTWSDGTDAAQPRAPGNRQHASNANAFTIAEADRQWFHLHGTSPPRSSGRLMPLSAEVVPGYDAAAAMSSRRREAAASILRPLIGDGLLADSFEIVTVNETDD